MQVRSFSFVSLGLTLALLDAKLIGCCDVMVVAICYQGCKLSLSFPRLHYLHFFSCGHVALMQYIMENKMCLT